MSLNFWINNLMYLGVGFLMKSISLGIQSVNSKIGESDIRLRLLGFSTTLDRTSLAIGLVLIFNIVFLHKKGLIKVTRSWPILIGTMLLFLSNLVII